MPGRAPAFLITKEYHRFEEFCAACRRDRYIGLCYGPPGVGKTLSARHYARWDLLEETHYRVGRASPPAHEIGTCRTVFYTPPVANEPRVIHRELQLVRLILNELVGEARIEQQQDPEPPPDASLRADWTELIIVDEADRLKLGGLEQLRDIYDRTGVGLILIGMPGLEKRLARYAQFYSRIGFVHQFRPLSTAEVQFIVQHKWAQLGLTLDDTDFTDVEAVAAVVRITGGNFRLLQRLFAQIRRILLINELHSVTKEVVEAAREGLVIGGL